MPCMSPPLQTSQFPMSGTRPKAFPWTETSMEAQGLTMDISKLILLSEFLGVGLFSHFNKMWQRHRRLKKKLCSNKFCAKHSMQSSEIQISASLKGYRGSSSVVCCLSHLLTSQNAWTCVQLAHRWELREMLTCISQGSTTQMATHPPRSWGTQHSTEGTPEQFKGVLGVFRGRNLLDNIPQETRLGLLHCSKSNTYTKNPN